MWFKKNKKEEVKAVKKDDSMSKLIDEVLNEQAAEKEAAMRESASVTEPIAAETKSLAELIGVFRENQNNETYKAVLDVLFPSSLIIPMTPVEGSENKEEKTMRFSPALVKSPEGEKLFPAFSDKAQIPSEHEKQFSPVTMPFGAVCELAAKIPDCDKIIVNPFTKPFVVNKELIESAAKAVAEQREKKNRQMVEFSTPEPETKAVAKKIADWFKDQPEIKQAYFSKMKQQDKISYVFIVDCPETEQKAVFERTIEYFRAEKIALPIALIPYKGLEKVIEESKHIEKVY